MYLAVRIFFYFLKLPFLLGHDDDSGHKPALFDKIKK
jgi:hypothetical protein